jgi:hypothetical protein
MDGDGTEVYAAGAMNSVVLAALLPIMLVLVAGVALIVYLRNKSEGDRYQHTEYRVDEKQLGDGNGKSKSGKGRPRRPKTK